MLDRVAAYELMHTGVWQRLPPSAAGLESWIIDWTVVGLRLAAAMRPPFPKNKAEFAEHLAKYPARWTAQSAATLARTLVEAMDENRQDAEGIWEEYLRTTWRGQTLSYLEARNFVEWLSHFLEVLRAENQALAAALRLPTIKKNRRAMRKSFTSHNFSLIGLSTSFTIHMIRLSVRSSALLWIWSTVPIQ